MLTVIIIIILLVLLLTGWVGSGRRRGRRST
jgi:type II secretory pathway pseudopilin PulG